MSYPFEDVVVVDLTRALAGPHAGMMLGDLGARVIKVESPAGGDDSRQWGPPFLYPDEADRESTYFLSCNRNKESITLNLKSADGKAVLRQLIARADVLLENFRTGVLDRLGFSVVELQRINPRLILLSITGFGHDGPEGGRAGYDQIAQGEAGLMSLTGPNDDEPTKVGVPIADLLAGIHGAYGVAAALYERERTGLGTVVRTSLLASVVGVHAFQGTRYTVAHEVPGAAGRHHPSICPYGLFTASDGNLQIAVGSETQWSAFAKLFGLNRTEWATNVQRVALREVVNAAISQRFTGETRSDLISKMSAIGVPCGQVRTLSEVYEWDQTVSQGLLIDVEHPTLGHLSLPGSPLRFDDRAPFTHKPPPTLGEDSDTIRRWLADTAAIDS